MSQMASAASESASPAKLIADRIVRGEGARTRKRRQKDTREDGRSAPHSLDFNLMPTLRR